VSAANRGPIALLVVTAAWFAFGVLGLRAMWELGVPTADFYGMFYPSIVHARESLVRGGGLLWSPFQACGSPFLADTQGGTFYPINLVFFVLGREAAVETSVFLNLLVAGLGMLLLARTLGLGRPAALCAALAFQLGGLTGHLASWSPIHIGTYAWVPLALWATERLVQAPSARRAVLLGVVLTLELLPGYLPFLYFTCQVIALRVVWAIVTRETPRPLTVVAASAAGLAIPGLLGAIQLLPALEMAAVSVRTRPIPAWQLGQAGNVLQGVGSLADGYLVVGLAALALLSLARPERRRHVVFYLVVAVVYLALSLGPGTPLFDAYAHLPLGTAFRFSDRFRWVTSFALAVLVGFGADAVSRTRMMTILLPVVVLANGIWVDRAPLFGLRRGDVYGVHAGAFSLVRERLTPQHRVAVVGRFNDFALAPKSPTIFRVPALFDYQAQTSARYADFFTFMRLGRPLRDVDDWYWPYDQLLPPTLQRPLFDLTAARYLIVDSRLDSVPSAMPAGVLRLAELDGVRVYENTQALPRARFVPEVAVVPGAEILPRLASPTHDARRVAVVERTVAGGSPDARGSVAFVADDPESIVVRVDATGPGFLALADQFASGWAATVNGAPQEIQRADWAFRLVAVPAGRSEVVFRYRPWSVRVGAVVSIVTLVVVGAVLVRRRN
jgi:hypothetical protein